MRDTFNHFKAVSLVDAAVLAADNSPAAIDTQGARSALILLSIGAGGITFTGTNKIEFVLRHGDDPNPANHVPVVTGDVIVDGVAPVSIAGGIVRTLTAAKAAADVQRIGYLAQRRYLSMLADFSGTHGTGTPISAVALLGHLMIKPPL